MEAVIFDMDGVIIDSEPLWRKAMISEINKLFKKNNIDYDYQEKDCLNSKGLSINKVINELFTRFKIDNAKHSPNELISNISEALKKLLKTEGKAMNGAKELLKLCELKKYKTALASSSSLDIIETVLAVLKLEDYFKVIYSGDHVENTKPDPEIFLKTQQKLNVEKNQCLIIEDSINGIRAAVRAGINCIAIPEAHDLDKILNDPEFDRVMILDSLNEVNNDFFEALCF